MTELNENHKRTLLVIFRHVDGLLSEIENIACENTAHSPFNEYIADMTSAQKDVVLDHLRHIREVMCSILAEKGVTIDVSSIKTSHSIHSRIYFADMAFERLKPKHMRGYGDLTGKASLELDNIVTELQGLLKQIYFRF